MFCPNPAERACSYPTAIFQSYVSLSWGREFQIGYDYGFLDVTRLDLL